MWKVNTECEGAGQADVSLASWILYKEIHKEMAFSGELLNNGEISDLTQNFS